MATFLVVTAVLLVFAGILWLLQLGPHCPHCGSRAALNTYNLSVHNRERVCKRCGAVFFVEP